MAQSIKKNFIYNMIQVVSGLLFPLITFPYISRVIMAEGIGQVQFFTSIINYIILFSSIGIPMYGIREIARVRDDKQEMQRTTIEIVLLNLLLTLIGYVAVFIICITVTKVQANIPLFLLLSTSVLLTTIGCPWFYSGVEDFKYIAIRGILVKVFAVGLLFATVHNQADLLWYGLYTVLGSIGNNILNFHRLHKYINFREAIHLKLNIWRHLRPALAIFVFNLVTSIYLNLDTVMLGFIKGNTAVGYYTAATRISHLLLTLVTSLGAVLLPRASNLIKNNKYEDFASLTKKAFNFNLLMGFPICIGLIVVAPPLIRLFSGPTFLPAILTLQLISPIIVAIGMSNLVGLQVLYPLGKINLVTTSTCVGAAINFMLNCMLIPNYSHYGAATATAAAEISVVLTQLIIARKYIPFKLLDSNIIRYFICSLIMGCVCYYINTLIIYDVLSLFITGFAGIITYGAMLILIRDKIALEILKIINFRLHIL